MKVSTPFYWIPIKYSYATTRFYSHSLGTVFLPPPPPILYSGDATDGSKNIQTKNVMITILA